MGLFDKALKGILGKAEEAVEKVWRMTLPAVWEYQGKWRMQRHRSQAGRCSPVMSEG